MMIGMGFLRLNKVLKKIKWTPSRSDEEIDSARKKEDRIFTVGLILFFAVLLAAVIFGAQ